MSDDEQDTMGAWLAEQGIELSPDAVRGWHESARWREYERERYVERYEALQPFRAGAFERTQQV